MIEDIDLLDTECTECENDKENIKQILDIITENIQNTTRELRDMNKLYHNEFSGRLSSMQEKLDYYQEIEKGRIYDEILRDLAKIYGNYYTLINDLTDEKVRKGLSYLFEDILQVLESYKVVKLISQPGDKRNTRHSQIREKINTDDPEKHDTVVCSKSPGFYIENRTLVKEIIDVYVKQ